MIYPRPCPVCGVLTDEEGFPRDRTQPSGRKSRCKTCHSAGAETYYHDVRRPRLQAAFEAERRAEEKIRQREPRKTAPSRAQGSRGRAPAAGCALSGDRRPRSEPGGGWRESPARHLSVIHRPERLRKGDGGLERLPWLEPRWNRHPETLGEQAKIVFISLSQLVSRPKTSLKLSAEAAHRLATDDADCA
jgi:hypothetical protein